MFDYKPPPPGVKVVSPPDDVLKKGNEKFKNCIVGTFTKASLPFHKVELFARTNWKKGLLLVSRKDKLLFSNLIPLSI